MADTSISIALSGMNAASLSLSVSASNVANVRTTGAVPGSTAASAPSAPQVYQALSQTRSAVSTGGVTSSARASVPSWVQEYSPDESYADQNGMIAAPNVDFATEAVNQITASDAYGAGARTVRAADEMTREAIDMKA